MSTDTAGALASAERLQGARHSPPRPTLLRSLAIQARVIHALLLREMITRFGRRNLGVLWLVVEPAMFTLGVAALWSATGAASRYHLPIVAFAVTGYSSVLLWRNTVAHCLDAIHANLNLLYHRNVTVLDVFAARILLELVGATASFLLLSVAFTAGGVMQLPDDALKVLAGWAMLAWFGGALALAVGAATAFSELVVRFWTPVSYLLFPLSGAAFMVMALPPAAQDAMLMLPMVHCVELMRDGFFGGLVRTRYDMGYVAVFNLLTTLLGLLLLRIAGRQVEAK